MSLSNLTLRGVLNVNVRLLRKSRLPEIDFSVT